jgi:hypothetical protein
MANCNSSTNFTPHCNQDASFSPDFLPIIAIIAEALADECCMTVNVIV